MFVKNGTKFSNDILVCYSLDSMSNFRKENNKLNISVHLSDYQISIPTQILKHQYGRYQNVKEFRYDLNFLTRESLTTRNRIPTDLGLFFNQLKKPKHLNEGYIKSSIQIILNEGLKLKDQFDSAVAYLALDKYPDELLNKKLLTMKKESRI